MRINISVNGRKQEWNVSPNDSLADSLRTNGYTSVKICCGDGACGTCTVLVNGKPTLGCEYLTVRANDTEVTTVEGLGAEAEKIVDCLTLKGAEGCGYCAPGFVVLAFALKRELRNPTFEQVKAYLNGNLCRCTGYNLRAEAVMNYLKMD
jgi:carbon-monoxide dehydrogenase small subunit